MPDTLNLYSTVKNPMTVDRFYGYLGSHGKKLLAGASYTFFGNVDDQLRGRNGGRRPGSRNQKHFETDLLNNRLELMSTPRPVFADPTGNPALANPTVAPTVVVTGGGSTGGLLAAGAYFAKYTWVNRVGETTVSAESLTFTVVAGNIPRVTCTTGPAGTLGYNLYLTLAGGLTNTETLYIANSPTNVIDCPKLQIAGQPIPPAANTAVANVAVKVGNLSGGVLGTVDPSWGAY